MLPFVAYGLSQSYVPSTGLAAVRKLQTKKGSVDLPPDRLPMVVRLRNIDDGNTIEELDPRDLAAAYGPEFDWRAAGSNSQPTRSARCQQPGRNG